MPKKHAWEIALEKAQTKAKTPKPVAETKQPSRQFQAIKGSTMGKLKYDPSNPVHEELASSPHLHDKIFITEEGPMVDTQTYRKLSDAVKHRKYYNQK